MASPATPEESFVDLLRRYVGGMGYARRGREKGLEADVRLHVNDPGDRAHTRLRHEQLAEQAASWPGLPFFADRVWYLLTRTKSFLARLRYPIMSTSPTSPV